MKVTLCATFAALLLAGCGESPEEEAKAIAKSIGLDDYKIIAEAIDGDERPSDYTGPKRSQI